MGSKKHKDKDREHKKKRKHRSRSKSRERESKRRHRDKDERHEERVVPAEYPSYQSNFPVDREEGEIEDPYGAVPLKPEPTGSSGGGDSSLSIGETNKLRAKLGLKPLDIPTGNEPKVEKESLKDDIHKPAGNWGEEKSREKIREKLERSKKRREVSDKLKKVKTLGESDSDEDAATWVRRNRMKQREKDRAEKTARMLEEMDEEFGIGGLVEKEFKDVTKPKAYGSKDLRGLKVQHDIGSFKEGQTVILTLQDRAILDDEDDETLVNVNMIDNEKAEKNVENRKKKPDYNPYDEGDVDEYGMFKPREMLSKYDEEIDGEKKTEFKLGSGGRYDGSEDRNMDRIREQLKAQSQTLSTQVTLASEYMTAEEVQAKFKKVKRKVRKIRAKKTLKADDLLPLQDTDDYGSRSRGRGMLPDEETAAPAIPGLDLVEGRRRVPPPPPSIPHPSLVQPSQLRDLEPVSDEEEAMESEEEEDDMMEDLTGVVVEEDQAEMELQSALNKARKVKQKKDRKNPDKIAEEIQSRAEMADNDSGGEGINITLNATSEFCRALGEIPTYGQAGNREEIEKDELEELERELLEQRRKMEEEEDEPTGWNRVEIDETPVDITGEENAILEEEPVISVGMAGALAVAMNKGFLEHEEIKPGKLSKHMAEMMAQNYSVEDKRYDDIDDKYKKRDRYSGSLMEFKEKSGYKPEVKLEYVDQGGRHLNRKEAFRQLSHRFHGKGSGKRKTEKRSKKVDEEQLMQKMSATDTPLNTVALLKEKQTQEKTPYIVLTGNKGFTNTMVKPTT